MAARGRTISTAGAGRDKVSYEFANADTRIGVFVTSGLDGRLRAVGGDADGNVISNVEEIVNTAFNDVLETSLLATGDSNHNTLEGRGGNDTLTGAANRNDYLIGGPGGDTIDGGFDEPRPGDPAPDGNAANVVDAASYI